jgi:hypothetical protein
MPDANLRDFWNGSWALPYIYAFSGSPSLLVPSLHSAAQPPSARSTHGTQQWPHRAQQGFAKCGVSWTRALVDEMSGYPVVDGVTVFELPPAGVVPDFDHPEQNQRLAHFLVFGIGAPLAFLALCQRFYTKLFLSKGLQLDDREYPGRR